MLFACFFLFIKREIPCFPMSLCICDMEEDKLRVSGGIRVVYVYKHVMLVGQYTFLGLEISPKCLFLVCKGSLMKGRV